MERASTEGLTIERWFFLVWFVITVWLFACAALIGGEYGDGYQTIINGRYFFGDSTLYFIQRGPLPGLVLWPVEMFVQWFNWNLVDVRPYHFYSAFLHSLYLIGCWFLIKRIEGTLAAQFLAFVAAILTVVFYAYAPYLSHDIIPGLAFLYLIFLCHQWIKRPSCFGAVLMVVVGTLVTFIKQTYAIFWVVLIIYSIVACIFKFDDSLVTRKKLSILLVLSSISGLISWIGYGYLLRMEIPDVFILSRPFVLMNAVSLQYGDSFSSIFTQELYLLNAYNYGVSAILLIIPGVIYALFGTDSRLRMVSFCWLLCLIILQLIKFREVRYLAFLAPLTAVLIVPVIQVAIKKRALKFVLIGIVLIDQFRGWSLSAQQLSSVAQFDIVEFLDAPQGKGRVIASKSLSFVYMAESPLERDPYHGIYHLTAHQIYYLYEGKNSVAMVDDPRDMGGVGIESGDRVYFTNNELIRKMPWRSDNTPYGLAELLIVAGDASSIELKREGLEYKVVGGWRGYVMLIPSESVGKTMPVLISESASVEQMSKLYGDVLEQDSIYVTGVLVKALCLADQCVFR